MAVDDLRSGTWVTYVGGRATGVRVRRCRLEVVAGPDSGLIRDIESATIKVGARRGNDVILSDSKVSGRHFEILLDENGYRLIDKESTNGTFIGKLRVNDVYIGPGTEIAIGGSRVRFRPLGESVELALSKRDRFGGMIGRSVKMRELFARLEKLAEADTAVLITGETGVGKELVAEALHEYSGRSKGPFVVVDCGSIAPNLIESELFGHEKGAFTGAATAHLGAFERAHKGTVFLDEIGELPVSMQPRLLRVLERHQVRRVGGTEYRNVDIRVVAATNRDLAVEVERNRFREDLYFRLAVAPVHVPPLRERREDIPLLVEHILASMQGSEHIRIKPETIELMAKRDWPGNVRELRNVLERAIALREAPAGTGQHGAGGSSGANGAASEAAEPAGAAASTADNVVAIRIDIDVPFKQAKQDLITEFERRYIAELLDVYDGNISAAARAAGIDRMSLHKMLNRLNLRR